MCVCAGAESVAKTNKQKYVGEKPQQRTGGKLCLCV